MITVNRDAREELSDRLRIDPGRIEVVMPLAVRMPQNPPDGAELEGVRRKYALPRDFVLMLGTVEPRHNQEVLFEALALLREREREMLETRGAEMPTAAERTEVRAAERTGRKPGCKAGRKLGQKPGRKPGLKLGRKLGCEPGRGPGNNLQEVLRSEPGSGQPDGMWNRLRKRGLLRRLLRDPCGSRTAAGT